jgi:DNA-binding beta-propeller fold protein YncE
LSRRPVALSFLGALALGGSLLAAAPALADSPAGALYVTQRDTSASANVASFTFGSFDEPLSTPVFAGSGGAGSFGIAVTPDGAHVYVTNDNGNSSVSQ